MKRWFTALAAAGLISGWMVPTGSVQADVSGQPVVTKSEDVQYLRLTDAPPQRDISEQHFAPLESRP